MANAYVIDAEAESGGNVATTGAVDTTGANLIILATSNDTGAAAVSDSKSNTWTPVANEVGVAPRVRLFYCFNPTTDAAHTFSNDPAGSGGFPAIAMAAFSGAVTSPLDQHSEASGAQPGSITPSEDNELVITAGIHSATASQSVSSPFDAHQTANLIGSTGYALALAYEIQTTATARNPTWSGSASGQFTVIASFKADPGGGGGTPVTGSGTSSFSMAMAAVGKYEALAQFACVASFNMAGAALLPPTLGSGERLSRIGRMRRRRI